MRDRIDIDRAGDDADVGRADRGSESSQTSHYVQPKHVWMLVLGLLSAAFGVAIPYANESLLIGLVVIAVALVVTLIHPIVGLIAFTIVSFVRPADLVSGLEGVPLAKLIGGGTFLVVVIRSVIRRNFKYNYRQTYVLLAFAATLFLSVPFSYWPSTSLGVALDFTKTILFYMLVINLVRDIKTLQLLSIITLLCVLLLSGSTILSLSGTGDRVASTIGANVFGDANDAALAFVTAMPLAAFWLRFRIAGLIKHLLYGSSIVVLLIGTVMSQSRGGLLGLIAVFLVYFMRGRNRLVAVIALGAVGLVGFLVLPSHIVDRYQTIAEYDQDGSANARLLTIQAGLNMMVTRPLTGVGAGAFEVAFGTTFKPAAYRSAKWNAPHNSLIQVGGETGLIGLGLFLYLYFYCLWRLKRIRPAGDTDQQEDVRQIRDILVGSLVGFGVCAFFLTQAFNQMLYFLVASTVVLDDINSRYRSAKVDEAAHD